MSKQRSKVRTCSINGCNKIHKAKGFCISHYMKNYHRGNPEIDLHERHGKCYWPEYNTWQGIKRRCNEVTNPKYPRYGGRGIKVCERWRSFDNFIQDMGRKPAGCTLDRIDNDGNYSPENCRWADQKIQQNNRSNNFKVIYRGIKKNATEWDRLMGFRIGTIRQRIYQYGWTAERAIETPIGLNRNTWRKNG